MGRREGTVEMDGEESLGAKLERREAAQGTVLQDSLAPGVRAPEDLVRRQGTLTKAYKLTSRRALGFLGCIPLVHRGLCCVGVPLRSPNWAFLKSLKIMCR